MSWRLVYTRAAQRDALRLTAAGLKGQAEGLLILLARDPFAPTPRFERLRGGLAGAHVRPIDARHRLVYQVLPETRTVKVLRLWTARDEPGTRVLDARPRPRPSLLLLLLLRRRRRRRRPAWIRL